MSKPTPESTPAATAPETPAEATAAPTKTADAIRAALRNKASATAARSGSNRYGTDQKPPPAPYGTRRSMGKR